MMHDYMMWRKTLKIQQPCGFKAMNVGLSKRLAYVFIYEHEKVMFLFLLGIVAIKVMTFVILHFKIREFTW